MQKNENTPFEGILINNERSLNLVQLSHAIETEHSFIIALVEHELIEPQGAEPEKWQFDNTSLKRARMARSFYYDLEVNLPGIALAFDLLVKIEALTKDSKD